MFKAPLPPQEPAAVSRNIPFNQSQQLNVLTSTNIYHPPQPHKQHTFVSDVGAEALPINKKTSIGAQYKHSETEKTISESNVKHISESNLRRISVDKATNTSQRGLDQTLMTESAKVYYPIIQTENSRINRQPPKSSVLTLTQASLSPSVDYEQYNTEELKDQFAP